MKQKKRLLLTLIINSCISSFLSYYFSISLLQFGFFQIINFLFQIIFYFLTVDKLKKPLNRKVLLKNYYHNLKNNAGLFAIILLIISFELFGSNSSYNRFFNYNLLLLIFSAFYISSFNGYYAPKLFKKHHKKDQA